MWGRLNRLACILQMKLRKQVFSCGFYENSKIIIFYRTHPGSYAWKSDVFLEITYNDSLQQCLRSSRGKTREKNSWAQPAKIGSEIIFFAIFSSFFSRHVFVDRIDRWMFFEYFRQRSQHYRHFMSQKSRTTSQPTFNCSNLTIETLEQCVKYVQN